jgi:hypothetical protein
MNKIRKFTALIITALVLACFSSAAFAQEADDDEPHGLYIERPRLFYAGLIGGANFCQVDGDNFAGYHRIGLNVGGIGYFQLPKHLAISWEILYSQKGAKSDVVRYSNLDSTLILKYDIVANYAEIPLMLNYFDKRKSHVGMGVSYSRLVASSESSKTSAPIAADLNKYPFRKDNFDFLIGAQLHLAKGLYLNIRFQYSLVPIRTSSPPGYAREQEQYNNTWVVRFMYLLK